MSGIGSLPGDRLAGMLVDLLYKLKSESLTLDEFALFLQRKQPFKVKVTQRTIAGPRDAELDLNKGHLILDEVNGTYEFWPAAKQSTGPR